MIRWRITVLNRSHTFKHICIFFEQAKTSRNNHFTPNLTISVRGWHQEKMWYNYNNVVYYNWVLMAKWKMKCRFFTNMVEILCTKTTSNGFLTSSCLCWQSSCWVGYIWLSPFWLSVLLRDLSFLSRIESARMARCIRYINSVLWRSAPRDPAFIPIKKIHALPVSANLSVRQA